MRRSIVLAAVAALFVVVFSGACGSSSGGGIYDPPTNYPTATDTTSEATPTPEQADTTPATIGEIWQWAIGRNVWDDDNLYKYTHELGRSSTDVNVQSEGFQLTLDGSGTVTAVTLYNDETALGFPASSSNFYAYKGVLPSGLSWRTTPEDIGAAYGAANQSGGFGTEITFAFRTSDGYRLEVGFNARHESDLPGSLVHSITVTRA